jgi:hypothetical protein
MVPGRSKAKSYREFLASMSLIASDWAPNTDFPAASDWLSGLATTHRKGYGGRRISEETWEVTDELLRFIDSVRRDLDFDDRDAASILKKDGFSLALIEGKVNSFIRGLAGYLDPTTPSSRYRSSVRKFLNVHDAPDSWQLLSPSNEEAFDFNDADERSEVPYALISQSGRIIVIRPRGGGQFPTVRSVFDWDGFEDDESLVAGLWG